MGKKDSTEKLEVTVSTYRWGFAVAGIVALVLGILILAWPKEVIGVAALIIALYAIGAGLVYIFIAVRAKEAGSISRITRVVAGIAFIIAGGVMLGSLNSASSILVTILGIVLGLLWVAEGITALMVLRRLGSGSTWLLVYGIVAVLIGIVFMFTPLWGAETLRWIGGFGLAGLGIAQIIRAMSASREVKLEVEG